MEGGARPEFYTIQLANEKELMEWKQVIHTQIEYCKQNNLKCGKCVCGMNSMPPKSFKCEIVIISFITEVRIYDG